MVLTKCDRCGKEISKDGALSYEDLEKFGKAFDDLLNGKASGYSRAEIQTKGWTSQFETRFDLCGECTSKFVEWIAGFAAEAFEDENSSRDGA